MSPFRRILADRGVPHPAAYSILIVIAGMLVSMATAVGISVQASNRAIQRAQQAEQRNRQAQAEQDAQNRAATCQFIRTISNAYKEDPPNPPTDTYKAIAGAWESLAKRCE